MNIASLTHWANSAPAWQLAAAGVAGLGALAVAVWILTRVRRFVNKHDPADLITAAVALGATAYAGTGTWKYLGDAMHYNLDLKVFLVAVLEGAQIAEALRSRKGIKESGAAGVDGVGLWVLTGISAALSTSVAGNVREALGRAVVPMVGAWLWERALAPQRRAARARKTRGPVRWRITPERIAVWLRLADAIDTDVVTVDSARRVAKFLRVTDRERDGWRFPLTAKARAYRGRMKLIGDALRHGDPSQVHEKLSAAAFADALQRLGIGPEASAQSASDGASESAPQPASEAASRMRIPTASVADHAALAMPQMRRIRSASVGASEERLRADALDLDRTSITETGLPAGLRQLQRELSVGQARATELRDWLAGQREQFAAVKHVNGHGG